MAQQPAVAVEADLSHQRPQPRLLGPAPATTRKGELSRAEEEHLLEEDREIEHALALVQASHVQDPGSILRQSVRRGHLPSRVGPVLRRPRERDGGSDDRQLLGGHADPAEPGGQVGTDDRVGGRPTAPAPVRRRGRPGARAGGSRARSRPSTASARRAGTPRHAPPADRGPRPSTGGSPRGRSRARRWPAGAAPEQWGPARGSRIAAGSVRRRGSRRATGDGRGRRRSRHRARRSARDRGGPTPDPATAVRSRRRCTGCTRAGSASVVV